MELSALAFNVSGQQEQCRFGFNLEKTNKNDDEGFDLTKYNILMFFNIRMNKDEATNKFPILQNYITREYVYTATHNDSDGKSSLLVRHLYGYKKELKKFCSFVTLGDQIVFKISNNIKYVKETFIIPVYLQRSEWESNFQKLKDQLLSLEHQNVVLIGDFNARVGNALFINEARENLHMSIKEKRRSEDVFLDDFGRNLIPWSEENLLTLLNGRTKSDWEGRLTFGYKSTIDLCFIKGNLHKYFIDFQVIEKRWGLFHFPIYVAASLSFAEHTAIPFSAVLAAAIRPFEPYSEEESEKSSELFEKYKQQIIKKLYFENLFKAFAKIEYKMEFWKLAKRFDRCIFLGQNIQLETLQFVQKVEELFKGVNNAGLINFLPLQRDEFLDMDLSINDFLNINPLNATLTSHNFYERAIESFNFNKVEIRAVSDKSFIGYEELVNFTCYKIMLQRTIEWARESDILKAENGMSYLEKLTNIHIGERYRRNKRVLYDPFLGFQGTVAIDSFFLDEVQRRALLCKLSFAGMSTKFLKKLENYMSNYDEYRKSLMPHDVEGRFQYTLSQFLIGCFFVSLVDLIPEGEQRCELELNGKRFAAYFR